MRVLVTGASGFVGRNLVPQLVLQGHDVIAATRNPDLVAMGKPFPVASPLGDMDWSAALNGVETVVHLAARAHVLSETAADPLTEHRFVNTLGTVKLAQQAAKSGARRFIFLSSIGVLGNDSLRSKNGRALTEEDPPNPHDDYSKSKLEAEQFLGEIEGIERVILRPPLIYGPGVPGNLHRLLGFIEKGRPFPLGAVHNKRSLLGVRNLCDFIANALGDARACNQTFVLADEEELSTAELYVALCKHAGKTPKLINVPKGVLRGMLSAIGRGKMASRLCDTLVVDSTKARTMLDWHQPLPMDEGLMEMALCI